MLVFGASGDLTKRLLVPALYNLACDGLLSENFALLGTAMDALDTSSFRARMSEDIKKFHTRKEFDQKVWDDLVSRFHYVPGGFTEMALFETLKERGRRSSTSVYGAGGNVLFYFADRAALLRAALRQPPQVRLQGRAGLEAHHRREAVRHRPRSRRCSSTRRSSRTGTRTRSTASITTSVRRPSRTSSRSASRTACSSRSGTSNYIDNIQFNVSEAVDVEGRGGYYDSSGVLRDMMQNHMFQMLAYLCMEVARLVRARRDPQREGEAAPVGAQLHAGGGLALRRPRPVRSFGRRRAARPAKPGYREEKDVNPESKHRDVSPPRASTSTTGAGRACRSICGRARRCGSAAPRSSSSSRRPPRSIFRGTAGASSSSPNRLIFHIQPYQGIEIQFQAKIPGPRLQLQPVNMRFGYGDAFKASRYTGYEVMIYSCSHGDATLFSRGDLVEAAWRVAQPLMDHWAGDAAPSSRTTRAAAGARRPRATSSRRTAGAGTRSSPRRCCGRSPLFKDGDMMFLEQVIMALRSTQVGARRDRSSRRATSAASSISSRAARSRCSTTRASVLKVLTDGDIFGEIGVAHVEAAHGRRSRQDGAATSSCSTRPTSAASSATTRSSPTADAAGGERALRGEGRHGRADRPH